MANKCLTLVMIYWFIVGLCEGDMGIEEPPCMKNLLPCTLYLHSNSAPPPLCCVPLKQLIVDDLNCLCSIFTNPLIMVGLNVTEGDATDLDKRCGTPAHSQGDICKNVASTAPTGSQSQSQSQPPSSSPTPTNSTGDKPQSAAVSVSKFGASSSIFIILYFVLLPML